MEKLFTLVYNYMIAHGITLAVCKDMQAPTKDRLIFVLLSDSRLSYTMSASLINPALSRQPENAWRLSILPCQLPTYLKVSSTDKGVYHSLCTTSSERDCMPLHTGYFLVFLLLLCSYLFSAANGELRQEWWEGRAISLKNPSHGSFDVCQSLMG